MNIHVPTFRTAFIVILLLITVGYLHYGFNRTPQDQLYRGSSNSSLEDYYKLSQDQLKQNEDLNTEVIFNAVGDIMLSREVANRMHQNNFDAYWPFRNLEQELGWDVDFNFGNLESPFSGRDDFGVDTSLKFNAPTWAFAGLEQYNFKVLNLANNHITNQGIEGLLYTRNLLFKNQMLPVGVGKDLDEAWRGQVFSIKGIRIGFIGATYYSGSNNNNVALIQDTDRLITALNELKSRSDFIVVTMHAGEEYVRTPNQSQINFAKTAIDNGADLVIGAHPHWVQTIEQYKQKYIFYSLGNFIFDQMWSQDTREGLMLKITLSKKGLCHPRLNPNSPTPLSRSEQINLVCTTDLQGSTEPAKLKTIELVPIIIENYGQPRIANELEKQNILNKIGATTNVITPKH
jgi:poly-gamma-glutamate synthesis protein (capsule biosynthesis protein)